MKFQLNANKFNLDAIKTVKELENVFLEWYKNKRDLKADSTSSGFNPSIKKWD